MVKFYATTDPEVSERERKIKPSAARLRLREWCF